MRIDFIKSAKVPDDFPAWEGLEIAMVGRSNAGKSSFINALTNSRIAKVSQTPGKTRLLQFFKWGDKTSMVDMPGYGFATGDRREVKSWQKMIEGYLKERSCLGGVLLIMDIRREWSDEEAMLREWLDFHSIPWAVILNKADKISRGESARRRLGLQRILGKETPILLVSSLKKHGIREVKDLIWKEWGK